VAESSAFMGWWLVANTWPPPRRGQEVNFDAFKLNCFRDLR